MGLDEEKKAKLRASMDYDLDGRLTAIANKSATLDAPILIIGLGGTGVGAVLKVKKLIYDRLQCEEKEGEILDKPANIEYLVMDTDIDSKGKLIAGIGFSETRDEIFVFTSGNIQRKLESSSLPLYISSWIDKKIDISEVINGAGANRQAGRFMLFDNIRRVEDALDTKIRRVTASYPNTTPLYVFILAGISGGTGSGTFLDIAYLVKGIACQIDNNRIINRIGVLFLPDVNLSVSGLPDTKKENIKTNGFAALKELDFLMNVNQTGDCFVQDYGMVRIGPKADGDIPPFETCILMSTKDQSGITISEPYEYTLTVAAETVLNFIASEPNASITDYSINSFLSNDKDDYGTFITMLGDSVSPVNYKYAVAGASTAIIPLDDIMSYMTFLAYKEIDGLWNRIPEKEEVDTLMDEFGLNAMALEQQLCFGMPVQENLQRHTYELIKISPQMIISDFNEHLERCKKYMHNKMKEMVKLMEQRIEEQNNPINEIFKDLNRGPVFAQRIIFTTSDNWCMIKAINDLIRNFMVSVPSVQEIKNKKDIADAKMNELLASKLLLSGGKVKLRNALVNALIEYYDILFKVECYRILESLCKQYNDLFMDKNNEVYSCVADLLSTLVELFSKYGAIKTETVENYNSNSKVTTLNWSMLEIPKFIQELEKRIENDNDLSIDLHVFIKDFYSYLFDNVEIWNGNEKADIIERLNYFISISFQNVLNKSVDFYINFIARSLGKTAPEYGEIIAKKLKKYSNIKFPIRATYSPVVRNPSYSFISIPENAKEIKSIIRGSTDGRNIVKDSGIKDRIFMLNFMNAMPLAAYGDLAACHKAYASQVKYKRGLHLYEGTVINWRDLPSPFPQSEWENGHYIDAEAKENQKWMDIFDRAVKYQIIRLEERGEKLVYRCYWGDLLDVDKILADHLLNLEKGVIAPADAVICMDELIAKINDRNRFYSSRDIYFGRMKHFDDGNVEFDTEFAKYIFIKMVSVRNKVKQMVIDYEKAEEVLKRLKPFGMHKKLLVIYIKLIYTGTIIKRRGEYVYYDKTGTMQSFCKLEGMQNDYPEYHLFHYFFNQFTEDNVKIKNELLDVCDNIYNQKQKENDTYNEMKVDLEKYINILKETISELNLHWRDVEDGKNILSTYKELQRMAESTLKGM